MIATRKARSESGIALLTTILLMLLMSSLLVGFIILISSGQRVSGMNNDYSRAFYAAEAGMEQLTAGLGNLFDTTYAPTGAQVNAITATPPSGPSFAGITFTRFDGTSGYLIGFPTDANGNPLATTTQIKSGPYQGMTALATPYTLNVTARSTSGSEVKLQRTTQTVGIPMFQFGIFSDMDLSFFPGPQLEFGGRTHTNGNLFAAANNGPVWLDDRVTIAKDLIRADLSNGFATSATSYGGPVNVAITTGAVSANPAAFRTLQLTEGSILGMPGAATNPNWSTIAAAYRGYVRTQANGVTPLNLGIVTVGGGTTQSIDLIRRPVAGELPAVTNERYFSQASLKILLSDDPQDILNLPCIDTTKQPLDLSSMAGAPAAWTGAAATLYAKMNARGVGYTPLPMAASGAASALPTGAYTATDGYWLPNGFPIIKGFLKIEAQYPYSGACNTWHDVTLEVLSLGYVGRNIHPVPQSFDGTTLNPDWPATNGTITMQAPNNQSLPFGPSTTQPYQNRATLTVGAALYTGPALGACPDPHPNAVIRLERVRDNPSSVITLGYTAAGTLKTTAPVNLPKQAPVNALCGIDPTTNQLVAGWVPQVTDFWPNVLFDPREGSLRDNAPAAPATTLPSLNGAMHYIELDAANLAKWFSGTIGNTGSNTYDAATAPNDFVVYVSDRRGNHVTAQTWAGTWPPLSPQTHETGEYGWDDLVNSPANPATGCPNNALDTGEDFDGTNQLYTYGADPTYTMAAATALVSLKVGQYGTFNNLLPGALITNPACAAPYAFGNIWPMVYASSVNAVRQNPPLFFRRAVKIVNGSNVQNSFSGPAKTSCAGSGVPCGLTITTENPAYLQGDYNANSAGNGYNDPHVAASIAADALTFLSDNWNDTNTFLNPYSMGSRVAVTTFYRTAIIAGKNVSFPQPAGSAADYGTDGGLHNFLRYIENWGGNTLNYRGSIISEYYSRQANSNFKCCTTVYSPPSRGYNFDVEFLTPVLLPPRTPLFRDVNTTGFTQLLLPTQ